MFIYLCLQEELWTGSQVSDSAFLAGKERSPSDPSGHLAATMGTAVPSGDSAQAYHCRIQLLSVIEKTQWLIGADWMVILGSFGFHPPVFFYKCLLLLCFLL